MEVFCRKNIENGGVLEYKMTQSRREDTELGQFSAYGIRVKYADTDDFMYYSAENISSKPQTVLQIIKHLFDKDVLPDKVYESIEGFLRSP